MDACVVATMSCSSLPLDADADGFPAAQVDGMSCSGGTDCDDSNATVFPGAIEACNNIDDNCNGLVDENCTTSPDNCHAPVKIALDAQRTATLTGSFAALNPDFDAPCGSTRTPDAVYRLDLVPGVVDITIESDASGAPVVLAVGQSCDASGFTMGCAQPLASGRTRLVLHRYHPDVTGSELFILVDAQDKNARGTYKINVTVADAAPDTCGPQAFDFSGCGTLVGFIDSGRGSISGNCQFGLQYLAGEAVMRVVGQQGGQIQLRASSTQFTPTLYLQQGCGNGANDPPWPCTQASGGGGGNSGNSAEADINYQLGSEEAIAVVDGATYTGQSYTLVCGP
jgi:hypothetical protein